MADFSDLMAATRAIVDPTTSGADLAQIAQAQPSLRPQVAGHPNAYPDLLAWLDSIGDAATKQAVIARRAVASSTASSPPTPPDTTIAPATLPTATPAPSPDNGSPGWAVLGFFIPVVGLILWIVWHATRPRDSKMARNGFIIALALGVLATAGSLVWLFAIARNAAPNESAPSIPPAASQPQPGTATSPSEGDNTTPGELSGFVGDWYDLGCVNGYDLTCANMISVTNSGLRWDHTMYSTRSDGTVVIAADYHDFAYNTQYEDHAYARGDLQSANIFLQDELGKWSLDGTMLSLSSSAGKTYTYSLSGGQLIVTDPSSREHHYYAANSSEGSEGRQQFLQLKSQS